MLIICLLTIVVVVVWSGTSAMIKYEEVGRIAVMK